MSLSASQVAKLVYVSNRPFEEKWVAYEDLVNSGNDDNVVLCEQLQTVVSYEEKFVKEELAEKLGAIYKLEEFDSEDRNWNEIGMFASIQDAERIGLKTGNNFSITRYTPKNLSEEELCQCEKQLKEQGYLDAEEQVFNYNANGELISLSRMSETGLEESETYRKYAEADEQLSNIFADFPICFNNGDIVRSVSRRGPEELYGIVHIFPNREDEIKRISAIPGLVPDDELLTEFLYDDGCFEHHHILVTELEKVDLEQIPEYQRQVLLCASELINGKGTFEGLQYMISEMQFQKRKKQI